MKLLTLLLTVTIFSSSVSSVLAQSFQITQPASGITVSTPVGDILRNITILFFTVGSIGFIIMILWGAVDWILSGGDKEKIAGARKRITTAIVGLVILSLSFVIMLVAGQILGFNALKGGVFKIPGLGAPPL